MRCHHMSHQVPPKARLQVRRPRSAVNMSARPARQVDMEERFCELVKGLGCTCVTISHRPALMAFHDLVLALDGEGGWSLHQGARAAPAGGAALLACARPPGVVGLRAVGEAQRGSGVRAPRAPAAPPCSPVRCIGGLVFGHWVCAHRSAVLLQPVKAVCQGCGSCVSHPSTLLAPPDHVTVMS